jgi:hypothetical protein
MISGRLILAVLHWQEIAVRGTFLVVAGWLALLAFAPFVGMESSMCPVDGAALLDPIDALRQE